MIKDLTSGQISDILSISEYTLKRIKWRIYTKFGVNTASSAIHKAHLLGII
jgi:DNA-binding CsgD family transcriptional regulator